MSAYLAIYLIGMVGIWVTAAIQARSEPTHGDVLGCLGCVLGLLWPAFVAYLIVASPWIAITWWQTRDER